VFAAIGSAGRRAASTLAREASRHLPLAANRDGLGSVWGSGSFRICRLQARRMPHGWAHAAGRTPHPTLEAVAQIPRLATLESARPGELEDGFKTLSLRIHVEGTHVCLPTGFTNFIPAMYDE
jgi:hypothetical protein